MKGCAPHSSAWKLHLGKGAASLFFKRNEIKKENKAKRKKERENKKEIKNNIKKGIAALAALALTLTLSALLCSAYGKIMLEKSRYVPGEVVKINLANLTADDTLSILSDKDVFKYSGELKGQVDFYPRETGVYIVRLGNSQVIEEKAFSVQAGYAPNASGSGILSTDKNEYLANEPVLIYISATQGYEISISSEANVYKYLDGAEYPLKFFPQSAGKYTIELRQDFQTIASAEFDVKDAADVSQTISGQEAAPEISQPETSSVLLAQPSAHLPFKIDIKDKKGAGRIAEVQVLRAQPDGTGPGAGEKYDIELHPGKAGVNSIKLNNLRITADKNFAFDEVIIKEDEAKKQFNEKRVMRSFFIDTSGLNFTNGTITSTADGSELWKCKAWNSTQEKCLGAWNKIMDLTPGKEYNIAINPEDPAYAETGVASINTNKPMYHPGETAQIIIVTLDNSGHLVSNADISLTITAPDNTTTTLTTSQGDIIETSTGIYETNYGGTGSIGTGTSLEGNYLLYVRATGNNVNSTMLSYFTVKSYYEFDIIRDTPVSTDPWSGAFISRIFIMPLTDTTDTDLNLTELVPTSFAITDSGGADVMISDDNLSWQLRWTGLTGNSDVSYSALPPLITPELYSLGPVQISYDVNGSGNANIFAEARPWYIAVDPVNTSADLETGVITSSGTTTNATTGIHYPNNNNVIAGGWVNPTNMYAYDNVNTTALTNVSQSYFGFDTQVPASNSTSNTTVLGILLQSRCSSNGTTLTRAVMFNISNNNGTTWSTTGYSTGNIGTAFTNRTHGSLSNLWGLVWNDTYINNIRIRVRAVVGATRGMRCDAIWVNVNYSQNDYDDNETYKTYNYSLGAIQHINRINISINVTGYSNVTSVAKASMQPDLLVRANNGTAWVVMGFLDVAAAGIYTIATTDPNILDAWLNNSNRNISIEAVYFDANYTSHDELNYTGVWISVNYTEAPVVNINLSLDNTYAKNNTPGVNFNFTEHDNPTANCTLYFDDTAYNTSIVQNNTPARLVANPALPDKNYSVYINCTNNSGVIGQSSTIHIIVDTTGPTVNPLIPENNNQTRNNRTNFYFNYTDSLSPRANCTLFIGTQMYGTNQTVINDTLTNITANASIPDGNYYWNITCKDLANNTAGSTPRNITIDTIAPAVGSISPENNNWTSLTNPYFVFSVNDSLSGRLNCFLSVDGSNAGSNSSTMNNTPTTIVSRALDEGTHNWTVNCSDNAGNNGFSTERNISIDITGPVVVLDRPMDFEIMSGTSLDVNATATDAGIGNISWVTFEYRVNDTDTWKFACSDDRGPIYDCIWDLTGLEDGKDYQFRAWANDTLGNIGAYDTHTNITLDTTPPTVNTISPLMNNFTKNNTPAFTFNFSDSLSAISICTLFIGIQMYGTNSTTQNNTLTSITANASIPDGNYYWNITCKDLANNTAGSTPRNITIDLALPSVNALLPQNNNVTTHNTPDFTFNYTDSLSPSANCVLYVNATNMGSNSSTLNNTNTIIQSSALNDGIQYWNITCTDLAGNSNGSTPRNITIDTTPPNITLTSPSNPSQVNSTIHFTYYVNDTLSNIANCSLIINGSATSNKSAIQKGAQYFDLRISLTGWYNWSVNCTDSMGNTGSSETWQVFVRLPDLVITSSNISINNISPKEGDNITINATVFNIGGSDAFNVTIQFFVGDPDAGGTQINSNFTVNITEITGGAPNATFNVSWVATGPGPFNFFVVADPPAATNGSIVELNESNNKANQTVNVPAYNYFYGSVKNNIVVSNVLNQSLYYFANVTNVTGNIFVTDEGSTIDFSALQAIGRDVSNNSASNDFNDTDAAMNMSAYNDSIRVTFTGDTDTPLATRNIIVFEKQISNVPIINSTSTGSFVTGMLWDTSDGGTQYNGTQDIAFITQINASQIGSYGQYDYEIRVPVNLKNYRGAGANVAFYWEITGTTG